MHFADASFLVSAFINDENGPAAWRWWSVSDATLTVSRLVLFEAENAIRCGPFDGRCSHERSHDALTQLADALRQGLIVRRELSSNRLYPAAQRLSMRHTGPETYGAMDIIHVAAAQELRATRFVSFDLAQRRLAAAEGLTVCP